MSSGGQPGIERLLAEFKRRRVFRVMAVYSGVAFVVLQIADILLPGLRRRDRRDYGRDDEAIREVKVSPANVKTLRRPRARRAGSEAALRGQRGNETAAIPVHRIDG